MLTTTVLLAFTKLRAWNTVDIMVNWGATGEDCGKVIKVVDCETIGVVNCKVTEVVKLRSSRGDKL